MKSNLCKVKGKLAINYPVTCKINCLNVFFNHNGAEPELAFCHRFSTSTALLIWLNKRHNTHSHSTFEANDGSFSQGIAVFFPKKCWLGLIPRDELCLRPQCSSQAKRRSAASPCTGKVLNAPSTPISLYLTLTFLSQFSCTCLNI